MLITSLVVSAQSLYFTAPKTTKQYIDETKTNISLAYNGNKSTFLWTSR